MKIVYEIGKRFPRSCDKCKLFVSEFGSPAYCIVNGKYAQKEIKAEKDGALNMYYHGCLTNRPKNCPLKAEK